MRAAGMHGNIPCYVQVGKAPFDVGGFFYDSNATAIGFELKETAKRETSIAIVGPEKKGSGLQYHQLDALVDLHKGGGIVGMLWSNAGEIGFLSGEQLVAVKIAYDASLKAEAMNKTIAKGVRSIRWEMFKLVKYGVDDLPLWLPKAPPPCERKKAA